MGTSSSRSGKNAPKGGPWTPAKRGVTSYAKGTGASAETAIGGFATAIGRGKAVAGGGGKGSRGGKGALSSSVKAGQTLGAFVSSVATKGLDETLRAAGLENLIGKEPHIVLSGITDYICGEGGVLDDAVGRAAVTEVLADIFNPSDDTYEDLRDRWNGEFTLENIKELMTLFLTQAIFQRFLLDLGDKIQINAVSAKQAEQKEKQIFKCIKGLVKFEIGNIDILNFDWRGPKGEDLIKRNLSTALSLL